jgi:hypothetical protein
MTPTLYTYNKSILINKKIIKISAGISVINFNNSYIVFINELINIINKYKNILTNDESIEILDLLADQNDFIKQITKYNIIKLDNLDDNIWYDNCNLRIIYKSDYNYILI